MEFNSSKISNTILAVCARALICVCAVALFGYRASGDSEIPLSDASSSETSSSEASAASSGVSPASRTGSATNPTNPVFMVVGFLGGFVPHNEPHHPEVQLIQDLRQEYSKDVYFGLFENRKVDEAYNTILKQLGAKEDGSLLEDKKQHAHIVLFGHSWGASAVVALSRKLERAGIPVTLTIQIDSVAKPFQNDWLIPPNVFQAVNFYQTHGLVHGRRKIVPADPVRTTILGNFLWENTGEPGECHGFSWRARFLSKGHIEIECDRKVWWQVETLLRHQLPNPVSAQSGTGELGLP
jgi:hypothetical protein